MTRRLNRRAATTPAAGSITMRQIILRANLSIFDNMVGDGRLPKPVDLDGA